MGAEVIATSCDITDVVQVGDMVRSVIERFGSIDVLINTAGIIAVGPLDTMRIEDFEEAMNVNFWGPLYTCLAVLPEMKRRGEGRIVNISSIGGKVSVPHLVPYSASKFALVGFSRGLRAELMKDGIVVTTVCPGLMRTGSPRNADFKGQNEAEYAWFKVSDSTPLTAMSSERAAAQVVDACRYGYAEVILSIQAKLAAKFDALFPEWDSALMSLANRLLPEPGGIGTQKAKGFESESSITRSPLTALTDRAAERNNEV
jgi:short-subunit dehydrogenase